MWHTYKCTIADHGHANFGFNRRPTDEEPDLSENETLAVAFQRPSLAIANQHGTKTTLRIIDQWIRVLELFHHRYLR